MAARASLKNVGVDVDKIKERLIKELEKKLRIQKREDEGRIPPLIKDHSHIFENT